MKIKTMKAAILVKQNAPLILDDVKLPDRLDFGQVLVKIQYSGICGSQIGEISGVKGDDPYLPHLLGHEGSGIVIETGPNVKNVNNGDHVVLHWRPGKGIEAPLPQYLWNDKILNAGFVTTFNEYAIVSENRLTVIPRNFDLKNATLFGCAVTTAFGVVNNDAKIKIGQSVLIIGVGGVGLNIAQAASMVSAYPIIGVDLHKNKLSLGEDFGLTHSIISDNKNINNEVKKIVGENGVDVVIECTGNSRLIELAYELTSNNGKTILVGVPKKGDNVSIYSLPLHFDKTLAGSHGGDSKPDSDIPKFINLIRHGRMNLDGLITHEFKLDRINNALELFKTGKAGRIVIDLN